MDRVRRIFFIFCALLVSFQLISDPRQAFYNSVKPISFSLFEENGKVGLKNEQGQVVIPARYEAIGWSNGSFSLLDNVTGYLSKGKWGLINIQNSKITKAEFEELLPGQGNVVVAKKKIPGSVKILSGCISTSGKEVIPPLYDGIKINSFRAIVFIRSGNLFKHGLIDLGNHVLIPLNYRNIYPLGSLRYAVEDFNGKIAIYSEDGQALTSFMIDSISTFKKDYAVIFEDQRQGLIDREGKIRIEPTFQTLRIDDDGTVQSKSSDEWIFLDGENKAVRSLNVDSIEFVSTEVVKIKNQGKYQLVDKDFKAFSNHWFDRIRSVRDHKAVFELRHNAGLMDDHGNILIKPLYTSLRVDNGVAIAQMRNHLFALIDLSGNSLSFRAYDFIGNFNGKFFPVRHRGFWGGIDLNGNEIIACTHDSIGQVLDDKVVVKFKGKYGVINLKEDWIITPQSENITLLSDTRYFTSNGKTTFLRDEKSQVIYFTDNLLEFKGDHLLEHLTNGAVWKIDLNGLITERFERPEQVQILYAESEGYRAIKRDNRYGFVDDRGRLRIANRYESVQDFHNSLAAVRILGKWGFIDKGDQLVIQPVYDEVTSFIENYSLVRQKNLFGLIDRKGKLVLPVRYQMIDVLPGERFRIKQNDLLGLADKNGSVLIQPKFEQLEDLNNGYVIVGRDGKFGLLNLQGVSTIPQIYDGLKFDPTIGQYIALKKSSWKNVSL